LPRTESAAARARRALIASSTSRAPTSRVTWLRSEPPSGWWRSSHGTSVTRKPARSRSIVIAGQMPTPWASGVAASNASRVRQRRGDIGSAGVQPVSCAMARRARATISPWPPGAIGDASWPPAMSALVPAGDQWVAVTADPVGIAQAAPDPADKEMIVASSGDDIVYTNLFTGVHGNYLTPSIVAAGLDPDNLPKSDPSAMNFGSGGNQKAKAWRDIWGCGQGIGAVKNVPTAAELVQRLSDEYEQAKADLALKTSFTAGRALMAAE